MIHPLLAIILAHSSGVPHGALAEVRAAIRQLAQTHQRKDPRAYMAHLSRDFIWKRADGTRLNRAETESFVQDRMDHIGQSRVTAVPRVLIKLRNRPEIQAQVVWSLSSVVINRRAGEPRARTHALVLQTEQLQLWRKVGSIWRLARLEELHSERLTVDGEAVR